MSSYLTFTIGSAESCHIRLNQASVSEHHAELVVAAAGKLHLTDRGSGGGTFRKQGDEWVVVTQSYVDHHEPIRFGDYHTTIEALVGVIAPNGISALMRGRFGNAGQAPTVAGGSPQFDPKGALPMGRVRRSVDTGEIIAVKED